MLIDIYIFIPKCVKIIQLWKKMRRRYLQAKK